MKDLSVMLSSPSIILSFCIGGAGVGILIFLNINYLLAFYLICAFSTLGKIDVYNARNHQFLYKFLRITKYDILRYRVAFSVVINTIILLIFTILYISFIGIFTLSEITLLPLIIINALAQHITMDTLLGARKRAYELSTIIYAVLWAITVIPILSTIMYIFAFTKLIKLRKESPYA
jgi:hypothetical protein